MKSKKIQSRGAILALILFATMLIAQSCSVSHYGCPNQITKAETHQDVNG